MSDSDPMGGLGGEFSSLIGRKPVLEHAEFDITAMIDLVFMMNIFFLVTSMGAVMAEGDLPFARHVTPADEKGAVIVRMVIEGDPKSPIVFIGAGDEGQPITDPDEQVERVTAAAEAGVPDGDGKISVIIKAEQKVRFGDTMRIAGAIGAVENTRIFYAVLEKN